MHERYRLTDALPLILIALLMSLWLNTDRLSGVPAPGEARPDIIGTYDRVGGGHTVQIYEVEGKLLARWLDDDGNLVWFAEKVPAGDGWRAEYGLPGRSCAAEAWSVTSLRPMTLVWGGWTLERRQ